MSTVLHDVVLQKNKKAYFEYFINETYQCGIVLLGCEVKSIKAKQCNFSDSFARIKNNVLYLHNFYVNPYAFYTDHALDPLRIRILLAQKKEIRKMRKACEEKGCTLVPLDIFISRGFIKISIGVAKGKKLHDKKNTIKQKTLDREAQQSIKGMLKNIK